jgi:hypothetical protein
MHNNKKKLKNSSLASIHEVEAEITSGGDNKAPGRAANYKRRKLSRSRLKSRVKIFKRINNDGSAWIYSSLSLRAESK